MKALIAMLLIAVTVLNAADDFKLQFTGVKAQTFDELGEMVDVTVRREIPKACYDLELNPDTVFGGRYAGSHVPEPCKIAHISTLGHLYPMRLASGVETVGELEVLAFIKAAGKEPGSRLLVDSRSFLGEPINLARGSGIEPLQGNVHSIPNQLELPWQ